MSASRPKPLILIILDGWGINPDENANAIAEAAPPFYRSLLDRYAHTTLDASGEAVGLPKGQMGNSEVGHLNIGAGRIVYQELTRISKAIAEGDFYKNRTLLTAMNAAKEKAGTLHLLGLLSDGGVHSHIKHLKALLEMAAQVGIQDLRVHPFLDGRDTPPQSALAYITEIETLLKQIAPKGTDWKIATVCGRFYAMDRDKRWERTEKAYHALLAGEGHQATAAAEAIKESYEAGITDEFVAPIVICKDGKAVGPIQQGDALIFFNFRADRARQLSHAFVDKSFNHFSRGTEVPQLNLTTMTDYDETLDVPVAFEASVLHQTLGEVLSEQGLKQLRIAETEKYAHVTYFFSGGRETPFEGEERILVPSPKEVKTYDQKPEMSALEVTEKVVEAIKMDRFDFICLNFANPDMVGHSGILSAAVKAVETIDVCLKSIVETAIAAHSIVLITADHGNLEQMMDYETGKPHTAHTTHLVPFICISPDTPELHPGTHANIAPTILGLMKIPKPQEMDHDSLIVS